MSNNLIESLSFYYAIDIIKLGKRLKNKGEYEIRSQLVRSGISIGANINESISAVSKKDFINKLSISLKEARETKYWLRIIIGVEILEEDEVNSYIKRIDDIINILISIINTTKRRYGL
jgi:four helix bundle protein